MLKGPNGYFTKKDRQMVNEGMTIAVSGEWRGKWDAVWYLPEWLKFSMPTPPVAGDTVQWLERWLPGDGQQDATVTLEDIFMQN